MYRKERKIPTILGILILFFAIGLTVYFDRGAHLLTSQAVTIPPPEEVHFTNITDTSFTVSWLTSEPAIGSVVVSNKQQSQILFDDLDSDNVQRARTAHYITVKNLDENSSYSIKVISGNAKCTNPSSCKIFIQKTVKKLPLSTSLPPLHGKVLNADNQPAESAVVYIVIDKGMTLSGRVDSAGLWVVPLTNLRSIESLGPPQLADSDLVQVTIKLTPTLETSAVIDMKSIRQNSALPLMIMGTSYNFIDVISKKDILANLYNQRQKTLGVQIQTQTVKTKASTPTQKKISILFPASEGDTTSDSRPRFRGTGVKGKQLLITVNSTPQVGRIQIGYDGTWSWRPPRALPPGVHHLNIQSYDENGNLVSISRKFIVLKSGEQVLGEATPSASLTPTMVPTVTTTITPISPSPTPSLTVLPSPTVTTMPTSPPVTQPPRSGNLKPTFVLFGSAASLLLLGAKLLLFP